MNQMSTIPTLTQPSLAETLPDRCEFEHKVFTTLGTVRFRRSTTDGVAMMALQLGEREAMLPLHSLKREFSITADSADGRMLDLIGSALDFVACVEPGDRFPPEVCTGEASWKPSPTHVSVAATRLRLDLVAWVSPSSRWAKAVRDEATLLRLAHDPALHAEVAAAAAAVAPRVDQPNGEAVIRLIDDLSQELAFIEALRETLQDPVVSICRRLAGLLQDRSRPQGSFDTLAQVNRLARAAAKVIVCRFEDVDAQTGEIGSLLRNAENQRSFIRAHRDWLYRTQRAWVPVLGQWARATDLPGTGLAPLLATTYRFLAQRSLPGTAWQRTRADRRSVPAESRMTW